MHLVRCLEGRDKTQRHLDQKLWSRLSSCARGTVKDAIEATKLGAFDFVAKSIDIEDLYMH